jgi:hypothetical protein
LPSLSPEIHRDSLEYNISTSKLTCIEIVCGTKIIDDKAFVLGAQQGDELRCSLPTKKLSRLKDYRGGTTVRAEAMRKATFGVQEEAFK